MIFVAKDLGQVADEFDRMAAQARKRATIDKGQTRARAVGEAYGFEQASRLLRALKWTDQDDYAIKR